MLTDTTPALCCIEGDCRRRLLVVPGGRTSGAELLDGVLSCERCAAEYPVLGGIPIVVPRAARWVATYREAVLASLVETERAHPRAIEEVLAFAEKAGPVEAMRFGDDWTPGERTDEDGWPVPKVAGEAGECFEEFLRRAQKTAPEALILDALAEDRSHHVLEIGVGVGRLAAGLAKTGRNVLVGDVSLRAVLSACQRGGPQVRGMVLDAERLPFSSESIGAMVALELVDLLDDPASFVCEARRVLRLGGRLYLATPDPAACELERHLTDAEFVVKADLDGVPWIRAHSERYYQVYFTRVMVAERNS
jgi:SAM-dependent methyltransferase/uncharacterized protein YbaR (Trm112 family)